MIEIVEILLLCAAAIFIADKWYGWFSKRDWIQRYEDAAKKDSENWLSSGDENLARQEREEILRKEK